MKTMKRTVAATLAATVLVGGFVGGFAAPASAATVGVCRIVVGEPHPSAHVQGNISSYGRLTCTVGMPNMHVRATLEKSTGKLYYGNTEDLNNVTPNNTLQSVSPIPCKNNAGTYRTQVAIAFTSPPGVNPRYHAKTYYSIWRSVACGASRVAAPSDDAVKTGSEAVATITFLDDGTMRESTPEELTAADFAD
jgi:hypothetical protein